MKPTLRVAYILHRFPYLTETFILREMRQVQEEGVTLTIYSLLAPKSEVVHKEARELLEQTRYTPLFSWTILADQLGFLLRSPVRYSRALAGVVWQTYREPRVMLLMLALFPKCVHIAARMRREGIDHVHVHFVWLEGIAASVITALADIPFSITPHAFDLFSRDRHSVRRELRRASRIVTVSEYNRSYISELLPEVERRQIDIVRYGVDTEVWRPAVERHAGVPATILSVGRAVEKKGHEDILAACALLAERGVPFRCRILAGAPKETKRLAELITQYGLGSLVELLQPRDQGAIVELYHTSDIFALASKIASNGDRDGVPNVLIEAMACELPVVSTTVSGIPELVSHEVSGLLVPPSNPGELAVAIQRLIENPRLRLQFGRQGRAKVVAEYRTEANAGRMAAIFRELRQTRDAVVSGAGDETLLQAGR